MSSKMRHGLLISMTLVAFLFASVIISYAETTNYIYDELNRLIRVEYGDGSVVEYTYDKAGNRLEKRLQTPDTTPPTTTASPTGGAYNTAQTVTLTCNDGSGSGCDRTYYTTDGSTPSTSSPVYSSPINISVATTLKFFAKDLAGNSEAVKTEIYTIDPGGCLNPPVKIGSAAYASLQAAYNAAVNGDIIKCRNITFAENPTINRNIAVTLDGGYDCGFTTNVGGMTTIKGMLTTTTGGGTLTIKNFILAK